MTDTPLCRPRCLLSSGRDAPPLRRADCSSAGGRGRRPRPGAAWRCRMAVQRTTPKEPGLQSPQGKASPTRGRAYRHSRAAARLPGPLALPACSACACPPPNGCTARSHAALARSAKMAIIRSAPASSAPRPAMSAMPLAMPLAMPAGVRGGAARRVTGPRSSERQGAERDGSLPHLHLRAAFSLLLLLAGRRGLAFRQAGTAPKGRGRGTARPALLGRDKQLSAFPHRSGQPARKGPERPRRPTRPPVRICRRRVRSRIDCRYI